MASIMLTHVGFILQTILLDIVGSQTPDLKVEVRIPAVEIMGISNENVFLPCDIEELGSREKMTLVLWYREPSGVPVYSYDSRILSQENDGSHWFDENVFEKRAYFRLADKTGLVLNYLRVEDEGVYRCRVDYEDSPTKHQRINLTVIVLPDAPKVYNSVGKELYTTVGPYEEGSSLSLICKSYGGKPQPQLFWMKNGVHLDDTFEVLPDGSVQNEITIPNLSRDDLHSLVSCSASNNNITSPVTRTLTVDMHFAPIEVKIIDETINLSVDRQYDIRCRVVGSRPPPKITWYKGKHQIREVHVQNSQKLNVTTSTVRLKLSPSDNLKNLTCVAENDNLRADKLRDSRRMDVHFSPKSTLKMGSSLNPDDIKEEDDVYFECGVKANPPIYKVVWLHEERTLSHNISRGIIMSNQSLVLQKVNRLMTGKYICITSNTEGDGRSNPVELVIKFSPICQEKQKWVYGVARREEGRIMCHVMSIPPATHFKWSFNNSGESFDIAQSQYNMEGLVSEVKYTPVTDLDYGTLVCWAKNEIGVQNHPCIYQIIPAGPPEMVSNCNVTHQTMNGFSVECEEGFNGGVPQTFHLEVFQSKRRVLLQNITNQTATFHVKFLSPSTDLLLSIFATNAKGISEPLLLRVTTMKAAEKRTGDLNHLNLTPVLGTVIVVGSLVFILAISIFVFVRIKRHIKRATRNTEKADVPLKKGFDDVIEADDKNPDIIPQHKGTEVNHYLSQETYGTRLSSPRSDFQAMYQSTAMPRDVSPNIHYAELALPRTDAVTYFPTKIESTIYAEIDHENTMNKLYQIEPREDNIITPLISDSNNRESTV